MPFLARKNYNSYSERDWIEGSLSKISGLSYFFMERRYRATVTCRKCRWKGDPNDKLNKFYGSFVCSGGLVRFNEVDEPRECCRYREDTPPIIYPTGRMKPGKKDIYRFERSKNDNE